MLANLEQILLARPQKEAGAEETKSPCVAAPRRRRVEARWDEDDAEYFPATIVREHANGEVDLEYDDGAFWRHAPARVIRLI